MDAPGDAAPGERPGADPRADPRAHPPSAPPPTGPRGSMPPPSPAYGPPPSPAYGPPGLAPVGLLDQGLLDQRLLDQRLGAMGGPAPGGPVRPLGGRTTLRATVAAWAVGRVRRLVPRGVPWTAIVLAAILLAAWVLFADILVTPGVVMPFPGEQPSRDFAHDVIGWVALMTTFGLGLAAATTLLQLGRPWWRAASIAATLASSGMTLGLVVSGPGQPLPWILGVALAGLLALTLASLATAITRARVHLAVGAGLVLAMQWALVVWVGATEPDEWVFLSSWTNLAFPVLVAIGLIAILAVAVWAQQVHRRADRIGRRILLASWVPIVAAGLALVVVVVRMVPLRALFGGLDANLWGVGNPGSWPHALVAGALVVWLVARSGRAPVRSRGHAIVVLVLATMAGMPIVSFFVVYVVQLFDENVPGSITAVSDVLLGNANVSALVLASVLLVPALLPRYRRSTGRVGALVALATAVPLQVFLIVTNDLRLPVERFAASPSQIALVVLVVVLALAIWGAVRGRDVVDRHLLLRLAIIPVVTMHAGQLLPGVWRDDFEQVVIVALSLAGLLLLGAPRTGTKEGNARAFIVPFATQMAVLGTVIVVRTMGQFLDDETTTISVLYLTMPVAAMLCCRLEDASAAWMRGASTVDLQPLRRVPAPVVQAR